MKHSITFSLRFALIALTMTIFGHVNAQKYVWQDTTKSIDYRVDWLIRNLRS